MLSTGDQAPDLTLPNHAGDSVALADLRGGWVLLYWYPKADTPGCTTQARSLRDQQDAFDELGCTVLGASFDTIDDLAAFRAKYGLTFDLLSDTSHEAGWTYGVAGDDGQAGYAQRIAYLIDPAGRVAQRYEVTDPSSSPSRRSTTSTQPPTQRHDLVSPDSVARSEPCGSLSST